MGFQGFFRKVCVGIYAALVSSFTVTTDIHATIFSIAAYTVVLCLTLFKTEAYQSPYLTHIKEGGISYDGA